MSRRSHDDEWKHDEDSWKHAAIKWQHKVEELKAQNAKLKEALAEAQRLIEHGDHWLMLAIDKAQLARRDLKEANATCLLWEETK